MDFSYKKQITNFTFEEVLEKTRKALKEQGFGVITEIEVKETFKKKLNINYDNYIILGACHPSSAYEVLEVNKDLGLMLPCNVIVYQDKDKIFIAAVLPTTILQMANNDKLTALAKEIEEKLKKAVDATLA